MLKNLFCVILNIVYLIVLNMAIYTDRTVLPSGEVREWHRSPLTRLHMADHFFLFYLQAALAAVSILIGLLLLFGVRSAVIRKIQLITAVGSTVMFVIILLVTSNAHAKYS